MDDGIVVGDPALENPDSWSSGSFGGWFSDLGSTLKDTASTYMNYQQFQAGINAQEAAINLQQQQQQNNLAIERMKSQQNLRAAQSVYGGGYLSGATLGGSAVGGMSQTTMLMLAGAAVLIFVAMRKG